ncbi:hypothetical protein, partial [Methylobacterium mesophilicum]
WRPRPFFHGGIPSMAYESQPCAGDQRKEKAFQRVPNPMGHVARQLSRLFNRRNDGWGARSSAGSLHTVAPLIEAGRVTVRMHRLPMAACVAASRMQSGGRGESITHIRMKRAAREWMRSEGADDAREEVPGYTGKFDAYSAKADWIVECGNSSMDKLIQAIRDDEHPRFTLIPYQDTERHDDSPRRLIAIDFMWDEALCGKLDAQFMAREGHMLETGEQLRRASQIAEAQARKAARGS